MMTQILSGPDTHRLFLRSLEPVVRAIGSSLGPDGRIALFDLGGGVGQAISGVDIAREITGKDGLHAVAQKVLREALVDADRELGDGTARLALMTESAFRSGATSIAAGVSASRLAEAIDVIRHEVAECIDEERCHNVELEHVAITAGADSEFAATLASVFRDIGATGVIELEASRGPEITSITSAGFVFDADVIGSPLPVGEVLELADPFVIAADDIISDFGKLAAILEGFAARKKSLVIVARDVNGSALAAIERNCKAGILSVVVLKPADAGPRAAALIEDLALATGAVLVSERSGQTLNSLKPNMLGRAARLRLAGKRVELLSPAGNKADIDTRSAEIEADIRRYRYLSLDREHAERRRARLLGQWAVVQIGGSTAFETGRKLAIGRNVLANLRSAAASGVIPGGGEALLRIASKIGSRRGNEAEIASRKLAASAFCSIDHHLKRNSGQHERPLSVIPSSLRSAATSQHPIYDPIRLTQILVDQALSIASQFLRVDAAVVRSGATGL